MKTPCELREISSKLLESVKEEAWSIENIEAHGAAGRELEYIGSRECGSIIYDYFKDAEGCYWYKTRAKTLAGEIVSIEIYIFGHEVESRKKYKNRS